MSPHSPARDGFARTPLFDLEFVDAESVRPISEAIIDGDREAAGDVALVVTPNTDIMVQYSKWDEGPDRSFFTNAWMILPDGQPIVWASKLLGTPLSARLCGSDLFCELWPRLVQTQTPTVVVAPSNEVAEGLRTQHDNARVLVAPMLQVDDAHAIASFAAEIAHTIVESGASVLILCVGHPKDPVLAAAVTGELQGSGHRVPYLLCLGGSAEFYLGIKKRAPRWVQRLSAEWLYRFAQEPRRLFHRYFVRDVAFVRIVASEMITQRRRGRSA